jgi:hypothetical protein
MIRLINLTKQEYLCPINYGFNLRNQTLNETINPDNTLEELTNEVLLFVLTNTTIDNPDDNKTIVYQVLNDWLGDNVVMCDAELNVLTNPNLTISQVTDLFNCNMIICNCRQIYP